MVFFDCHACGESIKKNQVEKHYQFKCRSCNILSCVDCGKNFVGDEYKEHNKCMTEDEKYGGLNYKAKANANKGERKQEAWIDQVQAAIDNVQDGNLKNLLERIKGYSNIPRKKAKFVNFLKNSIRVQGNMPERAWDAISAEIAKNQPAPAPASNGNSQNGASANGNSNNTTKSSDTQQTSDNSQEEEEEASEKKLSKRDRKLERQKKANKGEKKDKSKKRKHQDVEEEEEEKKEKSKKRKHREIEEEEEEEVKESKKSKKKRKKEKEEAEEEAEDKGSDAEEETSPATKRKFYWEGMIVGILRQADGKELSVKKLRKKVMAAYQEHGPSNKPESEEALLAKFQKKINKSQKLKVAKDRVKLL